VHLGRKAGHCGGGISDWCGVRCYRVLHPLVAVGQQMEALSVLPSFLLVRQALLEKLKSLHRP
jgi:hypothetical protein